MLFGNWSVLCSAPLNRCRTMGHIAVQAASPSVLGPMVVGGEVSFDDGPWDGRGASSTWLSKFDTVDWGGGSGEPLLAQRLHLAFDRVSQGPSPPQHSRVCARAWVQELGSGEVADVDMSSCSKPSGCGEAPDPTRRCWALGAVSDG
eukprot:COSAG04_NODE_199_length_20482_cov_32.401559_14_plen_147_part_00